jgi:hypothetical protein
MSAPQCKIAGVPVEMSTIRETPSAFSSKIFDDISFYLSFDDLVMENSVTPNFLGVTEPISPLYV